MAVTLTNQQRIELATKMYADGRIVRGRWHGRDRMGRRVACYLGALGADIDASDKCPADLMAPWFAEISPEIDDFASEAAWPEITQRWFALLPHLHKVSPEGWRRADLRTRDAALGIVEPHDEAGVVAPVRALIARELAGDPPSAGEWAEARNKAKCAPDTNGDQWMVSSAAVLGAEKASSMAASVATKIAKETASVAGVESWDRIADACLAAVEQEAGICQSV